MKQNPESEWFGERKVKADEKTHLVHGVFDSVAKRYDLMNDLMSGGVHRFWKDRLIRQICPRNGLKYLDVAGGTGDIAFRIKNRAGSRYHLMRSDTRNAGCGTRPCGRSRLGQ